MRTVRIAAALALLAGVLTGCAPELVAAPRCGAVERLGLEAQSVPTAGYVPCIAELPPGWTSASFVAERGSSSFDLVSDRAGHAVRVVLARRCDATAAAPFPPRTPGGRSYLRLRSIAPEYAGTMFDVFPGGCVTYRFDFARGPHIALMAELQATVGFVSRVSLRQQLRHRLGVELGP